MRLIDADFVLGEIDALMRSPWFNDGRETDRGMWLTRKEAVEMVRDLCVRQSPTIAGALPQPEPRIVPLNIVMVSRGLGWLESWYEADPEEGTPESKYLVPCAWLEGTVVEGSGGGLVDTEFLRGKYNRRYGIRIWSAEPTQEDSDGAEWDG